MAIKTVRYDGPYDTRVIEAEDFAANGLNNASRLEIKMGESQELSSEVADWLIENEPGFVEMEAKAKTPSAEQPMKKAVPDQPQA